MNRNTGLHTKSSKRVRCFAANSREESERYYGELAKEKWTRSTSKGEIDMVRYTVEKDELDIEG